MDAMPGAGKGDGDLDADPMALYEQPGYKLMHYVEGFVETEVGPVPLIKTYWEKADYLANGLVRCGVNRYNYKLVPGLYAVGQPTRDSEILVTANFKLTVDHLRRAISGIDAWILVLNTKGINVWCAAGKGTFSTATLVRQIVEAQLDKIVSHRRLIVPQLGATGVSATAVKKESGFRVVYGPVKATDIPAFFKNGFVADQQMRMVTFTLFERLILSPIELQTALKPAMLSALAILILSGIGPGVFSITNAWTRGTTAVYALAAGIISGAVITPALLPFIPVKAFALKGIITGLVTAVFFIFAFFTAAISWKAGIALLLLITTVSSVMAMNFTGTTPFTSPSGVEKEMKRYIPIQFIGLLASIGIWIYAAF
ncbi:MAG: hypothetical protein LJE94_03405 [Deltaproteobacteria bacterium]|nr:hypothetical protein [Deltaproteobacteria bacterium]